MRIHGLRIHIAGSANASTDKNLIAYAHRLIEELVRSLSQEGATFVVGVGREPRSGSELDAPAIIFDWTVIAAAAESLRQGYASVKGPIGPLIATVQTTKTDLQIPDDRRDLWQSLLSAGAIQSLALEPGWTSGALRRTRLAEIGDVLVIVSGGEGVEHLAQEYSLQGKPVIPLDLQLGSSSNDGSGGAARLAQVMHAHPERFVQLVDPSQAGALIARASTRGGQAPISEVVRTIVDIIRSLSQPTAFYVRLLNEKCPEFQAVDDFFRNVVDKIVEPKGYKAIEMGRSPATHAFVNEQIVSGIFNSTLVVADLTTLRPNCLLELGYALGLPRQIIATAMKGTVLPFDANAFECYFWDVDTPDEKRIEQLDKYWSRIASRPPLVQPRVLL